MKKVLSLLLASRLTLLDLLQGVDTLDVHGVYMLIQVHTVYSVVFFLTINSDLNTN